MAFTNGVQACVLKRSITLVLILSCACEVNAQQPNQSTLQKSAENAADLLKGQFWVLLTTENLQPVIATFALILGAAGLIDGRRMFKSLALISVAAFVAAFVLTLVKDSWTGPNAMYTRPIASLEAGAFVAFALYRGWEGTQLLLGLAFGMYLFRMLEGFALTMPQVDTVAKRSESIVTSCTLTVMAATWMIHERYGAGKVLGVLAPLVGSSFVVSAAGYFSMFSLATNPQSPVQPAQVPAVIEFWNMIAYPGHSGAVGYFTLKQQEVTINGHQYSKDKVVCIAATVVLFMLGTIFQLKRYSAEAEVKRARVRSCIEAIETCFLGPRQNGGLGKRLLDSDTQKSSNGAKPWSFSWSPQQASDNGKIQEAKAKNEVPCCPCLAEVNP